MNNDLQNALEKQFLKKIPTFNVGDMIAVTTLIREGDKQRTQTFKGVVLAIKGSGIRKTFTVRKVSAGIGVEKIIPFNSPNISKFEIIKRGSVRKSKIYYMRGRIGKKALKVGERAGMYDEVVDEAIAETDKSMINEEKPE